jgi:hypothetical protein
MPKWILLKPPLVQQGAGYKCWAAALESWCGVQPWVYSWTQDQLLQQRPRFMTTADYMLPADALSSEIFKRMAADPILGLAMDYEEIAPGSDLPYYYFYSKLFDFGYLYIAYTPLMVAYRHANVIWAADEERNISVMDPMLGGNINKAMEEMGQPFLVAWARPR